MRSHWMLRTHARAPNSVLDETKKSRGCLAGEGTLTANYSRPNEAQHARQIALGWAARDAAAGPLPRQAPTARAAVPHPRRSPPPPHALPSNSYVGDRTIGRPLRGGVVGGVRCGACARQRAAEQQAQKHTRRADRELRQQRKADFPQTRRAPPHASRRARRASARPHVVRPPPAPARGCAGGARERRARSDGRDERRSKEEEEKSTQRANAPARLRR